jgi:Fic family protein
LLGVSDATTERYLDELEKEGALKQFGKTGRSTHYKVVRE